MVVKSYLAMDSDVLTSLLMHLWRFGTSEGVRGESRYRSNSTRGFSVIWLRIAVMVKCSVYFGANCRSCGRQEDRAFAFETGLKSLKAAVTD